MGMHEDIALDDMKKKIDILSEIADCLIIDVVNLEEVVIALYDNESYPQTIDTIKNIKMKLKKLERIKERLKEK